MANLAQFTAQSALEYVSLTAANTDRDGTGTITVVSAGPSAAAAAGVGKRITRVIIQATGTTTAGMVRFFVTNDGGTTWRLFSEEPVRSAAATASTAAFRAEAKALAGLVLPGGDGTTALCRLGVTTHKAEAINVIVESGLF